MAGFVRTVRTVFTAQAGNMRAVSQGVQKNLQGIAQTSKATASSVTKDFKGIETAVNPLQKKVTDLQGKIKTGWADGGSELKRLNTSLEKVQKEFQETGVVSQKSMKALQLSMNLSRKDITRLGTDGKQAMKEIEQAVGALQTEMKSVGNSKPFNNGFKGETQAAEKNFSQMASSLKGLQKELQGIGDETQSLHELQAATNAANHEMLSIGKVTEQTMERLRKAMQAASKDTKNFEKLGAGGFIGLQNDIVKVEREMNNLGKTSSNVTSNATKGFGQLRKAVVGITAVAAGVGAGLTGAFAFTDQYQNALNKMSSATGATAAETEALGKNIQNVYAANYGNDMQDVAESMTAVKIATGATGKELEGLTKYAIGVRDTFGYDIPESTKVAQQMMKQFGISGEQAYNLITQGAQQGLDVNGDMLDTFNEYSVYFKTLGFDAEGMFNVLKAGSDAGAFNLDKVGDAIKEMGIRVKDGSKASNEAFADLGFDADEMAQKFAKGGKSSQEALKEVFKAISQIEDPVKRNQVGVSLMGTQFEDLEYKTIAAMGNIKTSVDMNSDALKKMDGVKFNSMSAAIRGIGRIILVEMLDPMQKKVMPFFNKMINELKNNLPTIKKVASDAFGGIANFLQKMQPTATNLWKALKPIAEVIGITIYGAFKLIEAILPPITGALSFLIAKFTNMKSFVPVMTGIIAAFATFQAYLLAIRTPAMIMQTMATLTRAWGVAQMFLNTTLLANPIGLIIAAIAGLAVALVVAYKRSETFRNIVDKAFGALKTGALFVLNWLKDNWKTVLVILTGPIGMAVALIIKHWDSIKSGTKTAFNAVIDFFKQWGPLMLAALGGPIGLAVYAIVKHWDSIKSKTVEIFNAVKDAVVNGLTKAKDLAVAIAQNFVTNIKNDWNNLKNNTISIYNSVKDFIVSAFTWIKDTAIKIVQAYINQVKSNWNALKSATVTIYNGIKTFLSNLWTSIKETALRITSALWNGVKSTWNALKSGTTQIFNATKKFLSDCWTYIKTFVTKTAQALWSGVKSTWNNLKTGTSNIFNSVKKFLTNAWSAIKTFVTKTAQSLWNGVKSTWNSLKTGTSNIFNSVKKFLTDLWSNLKNISVKAATQAKDGVVKAWTSLKTRTTELFGGIKKSVSKIFDDIVKGAKGLPKRIGDGIKSMAGGVKNGVKAFSNTIVKAMGKGLNGAIEGINWVLEKVDAPTIKKWKIPEYAKGTGNGKHGGGLAWLGDGGEHELYRTPDGKVGLSPNTDTLYNLPKGTEVLSGSQTKAAFEQAGIPAYDGGSGVINGIKTGAKWVGGQVKEKAGQAVTKGAELAEHAGEKVKKTAKKAKDFALDIWDWLDKPKELMKKVYDKFIPDLPKLGASAGDMLKGGIKKAKNGALDFITSKLNDFMSVSSGGGDGSTVGAGSGYGGMHPYVEAYYNRVKSKFGNTKFMGAFNNRNVRGGSSKSMHAYGRAFDIGGSAQTMSKIAEYARTTFKDLQYVIYNRRIAGIGKGSKWRKYTGQNPHTDHVHIDFKTGGGGGKGGSSKSVEGWRPYIMRAAAQMKVKPNADQVNRILKQINRESKGNEKIVQDPRVRDVNTRNGNPAKGLLQYIPQTFARYRVKGHHNIFSGFDQLLAFFNNSKWATDLPKSPRGWGPTGKRRFAKGGIISKEEEIVAGEDSKREAIIPLDRFRARAIQLFKFVGKELGFDMNSIMSKSSLFGNISSSAILGNKSSAYNMNSAHTTVGAAGDTTNNVGGVNITMPVEIHGGATKEQADMFVSIAMPKIKRELAKEIEKNGYKRGKKR
jgi:phage-related minor tail protein/SLT domain-containing protein